MNCLKSNITRVLQLLALCLSFALMSGCELPESNGEEVAIVPESTPETDVPTSDATEWASIRWHGSGVASSVQVMTLSASITSNGQRVNFTYSSFPWRADSLAHFFWWNGSTWQGGKFDWIRRGGQSVKLLENVHHGYNNLHAPRSGTAVAFAWTSADGRQRSNLAKTRWP